MFVSMLALTLGSPALAQEAPPEPVAVHAVFHLDRFGDVEALEECDAAGCWEVDLSGFKVSRDPVAGTFDLTNDEQSTEYWDCREDHELLVSICVWEEIRFHYNGGCGEYVC